MEKEYVITKQGKKLEVFELQGEKVYFYKDRFRSVDGTKVSCLKCGEIKAHSEFYVERRNSLYSTRCKKCNGERTKLFAKEHPESVSKAKLNTQIKTILNQINEEATVSFNFSDTMKSFETICRESTRAVLKVKKRK